jgi:hypothetical protein
MFICVCGCLSAPSVLFTLPLDNLGNYVSISVDIVSCMNEEALLVAPKQRLIHTVNTASSTAILPPITATLSSSLASILRRLVCLFPFNHTITSWSVGLL